MPGGSARTIAGLSVICAMAASIGTLGWKQPGDGDARSETDSMCSIPLTVV